MALRHVTVRVTVNQRMVIIRYVNEFNQIEQFISNIYQNYMYNTMEMSVFFLIFKTKIFEINKIVNWFN